MNFRAIHRPEANRLFSGCDDDPKIVSHSVQNREASRKRHESCCVCKNTLDGMQMWVMVSEIAKEEKECQWAASRVCLT